MKGDNTDSGAQRGQQMKKQNVLIAVIVVLLFGIGSAFGQEVSDEAKRHFDRGVAAVEMAKSPNDYAAAIMEFEQAARLAPDWPDVYYSLGKVQEAAEKYGDAVRSFREYLRLAPDAEDAEEIKSLINRLEYKKENMLSASEVIDVLISYANDAKLPYANRVWKESLRPPATYWLCYDVWDLTRAGDDSVRFRTRSVYPYVVDGNIKAQTGAPTHYYETARVEGRILRFRFTFVNWDTPTELEIEVEVVSKTLIRVTETVTKPGKWHKEWREGQSVSGELKKEASPYINR
jgi:tetratricopeptide (TPR) repeat protein